MNGSSHVAEQGWVDDVLHFWFAELRPEQWFRADAAVDHTVTRRFSKLHESLAAEPAASARTPRESLARVIVLDQFPRNIFWRSPAAFATDALALRTAQAAIDAGLDRDLSPVERQFLYMPFQHSEDRAVQRRSLELFAALHLREALDFAREHRDIVEQFGRFPHRNAVLGRRSTPEELEYLKTPPRFA